MAICDSIGQIALADDPSHEMKRDVDKKRKTSNGIDTLTAFGVLNCDILCDILSNESECSPTLL